MAAMTSTFAQHHSLKAIAELHSVGSQIHGSIKFSQENCLSKMKVEVFIEGPNLKEGNHDFHVHENADLSNDCLNTGGHFVPPNSLKKDVGLLGKVYVNGKGVGKHHMTVSGLSLTGESSIIGRSVVVHEVKGDAEAALKMNDRLTCGVIKLLGVDPCN